MNKMFVRTQNPQGTPFGGDDGKSLNYIPCYPVGTKEREELQDKHIRFVRFIGKPNMFAPGTLCEGESLTVTEEDAMFVKDRDRPSDADDNLTPRQDVDLEGKPIMGKDGKPGNVRRILIQWTSLKRERAVDVESVTQDVVGLTDRATSQATAAV